jgi:hypothetical protein
MSATHEPAFRRRRECCVRVGMRRRALRSVLDRGISTMPRDANTFPATIETGSTTKLVASCDNLIVELGDTRMNWRTRTLAASSLFVLMVGVTPVWAQVTFTEEWDDITTQHFTLQPRPRNTITVVPDDTEADDGLLEMRLGARPGVGPGNGAQIQSTALYTSGTFSTKLKTADCSAQPNAGVVTGFFTFFNDGTDLDRDGLDDNSEIDFEWLCAKPEEIYLTMWTDFEESTGAQERVLRYINLQTGVIRRQCFFRRFGFQNCEDLTNAPNENMPTTITPIDDYAPHQKFYEYGFTWSTSRVQWWVVDLSVQPPRTIILWDYRRPDRIPTRAARYLTNIWHTTSFLPLGMPSAKQKPRIPISQFVDSTAYNTELIFPMASP